MIFSASQLNLAVTRSWFFLVLLVGAIGGFYSALASELPAADGLVSNEVAARYGLHRAWFSHVRVDSTRFRVASWTLDNDQLFALSTDGSVHAMDAETGEMVWTADIAGRNATTVGMSVSADYVAVLSATRLHLLDRSDGRLRWSREIGGAPNSAPAIGNRYAYVALLSGRVEGYQLDDPAASAWQYQSSGRIFHSPVTTGNVVSWPTDTGFLYVSSVENPQPLYRIQTNDEIVTAPAGLAPFLYVASLDGYLYCFHEFTGKEIWRYPTGFAVTSRPAIVGAMAFVASEETALHAVDSKNGNQLWRTDGAGDFVAMGANYIYGLAPYGTLVALDKATGSIVGRIATTPEHSAIVNDQSDRIFLVNERGSVQCLREIGALEPTWYRRQNNEEPPAEDHEEDESNPFHQEAPDTTEDAVDNGAKDAEENSFDAEEPADIFDDDNPF